MLRGYTCDGPQETTATSGTTLRAQDSSRLRIQCFTEGERKLRGSMRQGLAGWGCIGASYFWSNYYAGGAAVGETTGTSGACWLVVKEQHSSGQWTSALRSSGRRTEGHKCDPIGYRGFSAHADASIGTVVALVITCLMYEPYCLALYCIEGHYCDR